MFRIADPWHLLALLVIPGLAWWHLRHTTSQKASLKFSDLRLVGGLPRTSATRSRHYLLGLRLICLTSLIVALARPQSGASGEDILTEGIDIVLALDISGSMQAEDIKPNRVEAAKQVAADFIKGRKNDRIGLVVFAGEAYTQCPMTLDYQVLLSILDSVHIGMIEDGTAIGNGLATSVNRLRESKAESRVVILLTDGRNNRGEIDPITAAQTAQAFGIKVYSVGAGTRGQALFPVQDPLFGKRYVPMEVDIDEETLGKTAEITGGRYFRATDRDSLQKIYQEIDQLETTRIEVRSFTRYTELFTYFSGFGLFLLLLEIALSHTRYRTIP